MTERRPIIPTPIAYYDKEFVFKESESNIFPGEETKIFIPFPNVYFGYLKDLPPYRFTVFKVTEVFAKSVFVDGADNLYNIEEESIIIDQPLSNKTPYHMVDFPDGYYVFRVDNQQIWDNKKNIRVYTKSNVTGVHDFDIAGKEFLLFFPLVNILHEFVDSKFEKSDYLIINRSEETYSVQFDEGFKKHVEFLIDQLNDNIRFSNLNKFYIIVKTNNQTYPILLNYINKFLYNKLLSKGLYFNIVKSIENMQLLDGEEVPIRTTPGLILETDPDVEEEGETSGDVPMSESTQIPTIPTIPTITTITTTTQTPKTTTTQTPKTTTTQTPKTTFEKYKDSYKTWLKNIFKDGLYFVPNYKSVIINVDDYNKQLKNLMENFKHIIQHKYFENRTFMFSKESKNENYLKWLRDNNGNNTVVSWLTWLGFSINSDRHVLKLSHRENVNDYSTIKFDEIAQSYQFVYQIFLNPNLIHLTERSLFPFLREGDKPKTFDTMITKKLAELEVEKNFFGHYVTMFGKYRDLFDEYDLPPLKRVSLKYFLQELYKFVTFIIPTTKRRLKKMHDELNRFRLGLMTCDYRVRKMYISYDISRYKESMYEKFVKFGNQLLGLNIDRGDLNIEQHYYMIENKQIVYTESVETMRFSRKIVTALQNYVNGLNLEFNQTQNFMTFLSKVIDFNIFLLSNKNRTDAISESFDMGFKGLLETFVGDYNCKQNTIKIIKSKKREIIAILTSKDYYNWYYDQGKYIKVLSDNDIKILIEGTLKKLRVLIPGEEVAQLQTLINMDDEFEDLINDYFAYNFGDEKDVDYVLELLRSYMFTPNIGEIHEMLEFYKKLLMIKHYYKGKTEPVEEYKKLVSELNYEIHKLLSYMKETKTNMLLGFKNNKELEDRYLNLKGKYLDKKLIAMESKANTEKTFKNFKRFITQTKHSEQSKKFFEDVKVLKLRNRLKYDFYLAILFRVWQSTTLEPLYPIKNPEIYFIVKLDSVKSLVIKDAIFHDVIETFFMKNNEKEFSLAKVLQEGRDLMDIEQDDFLNLTVLTRTLIAIIEALNEFDSEKTYQQ